MKTAIINYNAGNVRSVAFALERLGISPVLTADPGELRSADRVIFPGVGEAGSAMNYLKRNKLDKVIIELKQPVLGICLGMQLLCDSSEESETDCLGIFPLKVRKFNETNKVPQIGWNTISGLRCPLFKGVAENEHVYFVHSYYAESTSFTTAAATYGLEYSAAIRKDNFFGVQFHPEKSGSAGQRILENFFNIEI